MATLFDDSVDEALVADAIAASNRTSIEPVTIEHRPDHSYRKGPKGSRGCKQPMPDGRDCGAARFAPVHNVPTLNEVGAAQDWRTFSSAIKPWRAWLAGALADSGLPRGLDSVLVEGVMTFPTRAKRDQGNHRYFVEKALGDALVRGNVETRTVMLPSEVIEGGWLEDDDWSRYEFGNLAFRYVRGE
jgi:hypothetical protein